jgi:hypothetical protein
VTVWTSCHGLRTTAYGLWTTENGSGRPPSQTLDRTGQGLLSTNSSLPTTSSSLPPYSRIQGFSYLWASLSPLSHLSSPPTSHLSPLTSHLPLSLLCCDRYHLFQHTPLGNIYIVFLESIHSSYLLAFLCHPQSCCLAAFSRAFVPSTPPLTYLPYLTLPIRTSTSPALLLGEIPQFDPSTTLLWFEYCYIYSASLG